MRVLFVTHNVPRYDGDVAGAFVLRLAVALQAQGARVDIVAPGASGLTTQDTIEGVVIHRVRYANDAHMTLAYTGTMVEQVRSSWRARWRMISMLRALRRGTRAIIDNAHRAGDPYDVVHVHWWFPAGLALWRGLPTRRETGAPARLLTMHGSDVRLAKNSALARALMRVVIDESEVATAVSAWLAQTAATASPARATRVAPMPVDVTQFLFATDTARTGILFVGRLNAQKGIADLVHALAHHALRSAILHVVGDGPAGDALKAEAVAAGVASRIRWHGSLPQASLVPMYQHASVVAMPSREEGLGLVAVEAQLCGTPVVAYASGGLTDVVQPAAGGTLVPVGDIEQLATAIARLLDDPSEAARQGSLARAAMVERFSPTSVAQTYQALYREAIAARVANGAL